MDEISIPIFAMSVFDLCVGGMFHIDRVKRWPTDLTVPSSIPAQDKIFSTVNRVPLHTAFHYQPLIVLI